jgi:hypothetical protein
VTDSLEGSRHRTHAVLAAVAVVFAFVVVIVIAALFAGQGRDDFKSGSVDQLTKALRAQGLTLCPTAGGTDSGDPKGGSVSTQVLNVALPGGCDDNPVAVQVDAYRNKSDRDAAARQGEMQEKQRNYGVVYTWDHFTVYLQADDAGASTDVRDRVIDALDSVGAN